MKSRFLKQLPLAVLIAIGASACGPKEPPPVAPAPPPLPPPPPHTSGVRADPPSPPRPRADLAESDYEDLLEAGRARLGREEWEAAITLFERAAAAENADWRAHYQLGAAYRGKLLEDGAEADLEYALESLARSLELAEKDAAREQIRDLLTEVRDLADSILVAAAVGAAPGSGDSDAEPAPVEAGAVSPPGPDPPGSDPGGPSADDPGDPPFGDPGAPSSGDPATGAASGGRDPDQPAGGPPTGRAASQPIGETILTVALVLAALYLFTLAFLAAREKSPTANQQRVFKVAIAGFSGLLTAVFIRVSGYRPAVREEWAAAAAFAVQSVPALGVFLTVYLLEPLQRLTGRSASPAAASPTAAPPPTVAAGRRSIFLSYRRADSEDVTGRIYEHLVGRYGSDAVFRDVQAIPLGLDFREQMVEALRDCRVVLAVIGPDWRHAAREEGDKRLDDPTDYVRIELASALKRRLPLIPLLVRGVDKVPSRSQLPEALRGLATRNGMRVRPDPDFENDMRRLTEGIDHLLARAAETAEPADDS